MLIVGQPVVKKLVTATGAENYNVLQNNGKLAHQEVDHVSIPWQQCDGSSLIQRLTGSFPYGQ